MFGARLDIKNLLIECLATWDGAGAFVDDIAYLLTYLVMFLVFT